MFYYSPLSMLTASPFPPKGKVTVIIIDIEINIRTFVSGLFSAQSHLPFGTRRGLRHLL